MGIIAALWRIIANLVIVAVELAAIAGLAWLAFREPLVFAGATALAVLVLGTRLEWQRLSHEWPFYFGGKPALAGIPIALAAGIETLVKAVLGGAMALLMVSGTDQGRLWWTAAVFAALLFAATSLLRRLRLSFGANAGRWGYFRLAALMGLAFSAAMALLIEPPTLGRVAWSVFLDLPARPNLQQASEALFLLKQTFDQLIVTVAGGFVDPAAARAVGILISVNVLAGFVIAAWAVPVAGLVRQLEDALLP